MGVLPRETRLGSLSLCYESRSISKFMADACFLNTGQGVCAELSNQPNLPRLCKIRL